MRVVFRPEAWNEVKDAKAWYEASAPGLGFDFVRALESAIEAANRMPKSFPVIRGESRRVLLRRFPYSLIFRAREDSLLIVAVFHHRREPTTWLSRDKN